MSLTVLLWGGNGEIYPCGNVEWRPVLAPVLSISWRGEAASMLRGNIGAAGFWMPNIVAYTAEAQ
jgi:hypothetical protein